MTTQDARERAWQEWEATHVRAWIARAAFEDGWDAAKREDEQRIAALVAYVKHRPDCRKEWAESVAGEGKSWPCTCGLREAVRALTGSEEEHNAG